MKLTNPEKLIILMLSEIYDKLELTDIDTKLLRSAIYSENTWALDWDMPGVVGSESEPTPPEVIEVSNYLDMWYFMEEAYSSFSADNKTIVEQGAQPFGKNVRLPGFDGNNEAELLSIAHILIEDMGRFSRFKGRDLNSHAPLRNNYAQMFKVFEPMRSNLAGSRNLSPDQIIKLLQAMRNQQ